MTDSAPDFDEILAQQKKKGELETRRDVWLTAAVMTLLLPPGTLFGILALLVALGSRRALDANDLDRAEGKLAICRILVMVGTVLGVALFFTQVSAFASITTQINQLLEADSHRRSL